MITVETEVKQSIAIWAFPIREWTEKQEYRYSGKWEFKICTDKPYQDGAVKVCEQEVALLVPAGIDLRFSAIETLEEQMSDEIQRHRKVMDEIRDKISQLKQLTYQPTDENVIDLESHRDNGK